MEDLRNYRQLYLCFSDLEIWYTRVPNLTWSHYRTLLSVTNDDARYWYVQEAAREMWSVRTWMPLGQVSDILIKQR